MKMTALFQNHKVSVCPVKVEQCRVFGPPVPTKKVSNANKPNFSYSIRPMYYFSRAFGLFPFTMIYDTNGDVQGAHVTLFDILWFFISIFLYLLMAFYCYMNMDLPQNPNDSYILNLGDYALLIVGLIYGAIIILLDMFNRFGFIDLVKNITTFDKEVSKPCCIDSFHINF